MGMGTHKIKGEDYYQCRDVKAERDKLLEEVAELLDRLEASEADALEQARLNGMGAEREMALMAKLEAAEKERDALRAKIEAMEQEPPRGWWDDLIADISAIDCMYRGSPTYAHDAYWMRDRVVWTLKQRRDSTPGVNGEAK